MRTDTSYFKTFSKMMWFMALLLVVFTAGCDRDHGAAAPPPPPAGTVPSVTFTVPANGDTDVQINRRITATFSEVMDAATLVSPAINYTVKESVSGNSVAGTVTYNGETAVFTPSSALAVNTLYVATITTVATSQAGIAMAEDFTWSFTSGLSADITAPTLVSTGATTGDTGLPINRVATATFSEPMDPATLASPATNFTMKEFVSGISVPGVVTYLGNTATFTPNSNLLPNTKYETAITTGATDLAGNALVPGLRANPWSWTTGASADTTPPTVLHTIPVHLATNVQVGSSITATFSEGMRPATVTTANFIVTNGVTTVLGTVVYDTLTNVAVFTPLNPLASSTTYTALITAGSKDLAGNALASGVVPNPWRFTTAAAAGVPPTVLSVTPTDIASDACVNNKISATFSKAMSAPTVTAIGTFTVKQTFGSALTGTVTYDALTNIATFATATLASNTDYTATITTAAKDLAGTAMAANKVWSFATGTALICAPQINLGLLTPFGISSYGGISNAGATKINGNVVLDPTAKCNLADVLFVDGPGFGLCGGNPINVPTNNPGDLVITPLYPDAVTAPPIMALLTAKWNSITKAGLPGGTVLGCGTIGNAGDAGALIGCAGNSTLPPGIYISSTDSTINVTGDLTLDGQGDQNAVFVFQAPSAALTITPGSPGIHARILLINGAKASNVWWEVGSSATIGDYAEFNGNILASASISMGTNATSCGRLLAGAEGSGAFTFLGNTVSVPGHAQAPAGCK